MSGTTFGKPPLVEVSFSVLFGRLPAFTTAYFGLLWQQFRADFPETADKTPAGLAIGDFLPGPGFEWFSPARVWFIHRDKALLLQVQQDRLFLNWRRIAPQAEYPRFDNLLPIFLEYFARLSAFVEDNGLGVLKPARCNLGYVNHITASERWPGFNEIGRVFPGVQWNAPGTTVSPTGFAWQVAWSTEDMALQADLKSARTTDAKDLAIFELKTDSVPPIIDTGHMHSWFVKANNALVDAFLNLTSDWAQNELWARA